MLRPRLLVVIVALVSAAGCFGGDDDGRAGAGPEPPPLDEYAYTGVSCIELALEIPVPAAGVRPHVPKEYTLVGDGTGQAVFALAITKCQEASIPGTNGTVSFIQSDMAVLVDTPGGQRPTSSYQLWMPVTNGSMAHDLGRVGMPSFHAPLSSLTTFSLVEAETVEARIVAEGLSLTVTATATQAPAPTTLSNTYWHQSEEATTRMDYEVAVATIGPARGELEVSGGILADALGSAQVEGTGILATFDLTASAQRTPA